MAQPAGRTTSQRQPAGGSLRPIKREAFGYEQARHLLWRAGFGGTPSQVQTLVSWGPERSVDHLLDFESIPFREVSATDFDRNIMRPPTAEERMLAANARRAGDENALARLQLLRQQAERSDRRQVREMQRWWLTRMIETPRPLEEKMTLFWHGHFATSYRTIEDSYHMFAQNQLFRKHAVGNFGALLASIIRDPAMLAYLDNNRSRRDRPNENLARELMELFSLGVGNYSERDIKEGARALTGYTFSDDEFAFDQRNHDDGDKSILGRRGKLDGDGFVRAILEHPACARYMSWKLYRYFAAEMDAAPESLPRPARDVVEGLADTMRRSSYEVRPVLRRLLLSEHFYDASVVGEQIKSPVQLVVGAVRSMLTPVRDLSILLDALALMGQNLMFPPSVAGWAGGRSWINTSTLYVRQNILAFLLTGKKPQGYDALADRERYDPSGLLESLSGAEAGAVRDPVRVAEYLLRFAVGRVPEGAVEPLVALAKGAGGEVTPDVVTGMLLLITAMPEYQLC